MFRANFQSLFLSLASTFRPAAGRRRTRRGGIGRAVTAIVSQAEQLESRAMLSVVTPVWSDKIVDSVGVDVGQFNDRTYLEQDYAALGVRHGRGGTDPQSAQLYNNLGVNQIYVTQQGIDNNYLVGTKNFSNNGFESGDLTSWGVSGATYAAYVQSYASAGVGALPGGALDVRTVSNNDALVNYSAAAYSVTTSQSESGLAAGTYDISLWVNPLGASTMTVTASGFGGASVSNSITTTNGGGYAGWQLLRVGNINITNGSLNIAITTTSANGNSGAAYDQILVNNPHALIAYDVSKMKTLVSNNGPGYLNFIEASNEIDAGTNAGFEYDGLFGIYGYKGYMQDLYSTAKNDPVIGVNGLNIPVAADAMGGDGRDALTPQIANTGNADYGNSHPYHNYGANPLVNINPAADLTSGANFVNSAQIQTPGKPLVATEYGYSEFSFQQGNGVGNQNTEIKYTLRGVMEQYLAGFSQSYIYDMVQDGSGFGLFEGNGQIDPWGTGLKNLLGVLNDNSWNTTTKQWAKSAFVGTPLDMTLSAPSTVHYLLTQKSDGYYLCMWNEVPNWTATTTYSTGYAVDYPPFSVTLNASNVATNGTLYTFNQNDGSYATSGVTLNNGQATFNVNDTMTIIKLSPSGPIGQTITIKGDNGNYVSERENLPGTPVQEVASAASVWEQFNVVDEGNGKVALQSTNSGLFVSERENLTGAPLEAIATVVGVWETFTWIDAGGGKFALKANSGNYVSARQDQTGTPLLANVTAIGAWEKFSYSLPAPIGQTISITGDNGNYISERENVTNAPVQDVSTVASVWEQFKVVDAGSGKVALQSSSSGLYLSERENVTNAPLQAIGLTVGAWETFTWINVGNGRFALQANSGKYVSAREDQTGTPLFANATAIGAWETFSDIQSVPVGQTITISGDNGNYVSERENLANAPVQDNATIASSWENFNVVDAGNGKVALQSTHSRLYLSERENVANAPLQAISTTISTWETFTWIYVGGGKFALQANSGNYVSARQDQTGTPLLANVTAIGAWEKFSFGNANLVAVTRVTPGTLRNNFTGYVGEQFTTGSNTLLVKSLGDWVVAGNSQIHSVELVDASNGAIIASASVNHSGVPSGQFAYAALANAITLSANHSYYVLTQETNVGDQWYDQNTLLVGSPDITINKAVFTSDNLTFNGANNGSIGYGPATFGYIIDPPAVTSTTLGNLRNNFTGYVGFSFTTGTTALFVESLGMWVVAGNTQTHVVKLVDATTGAIVASVSIDTSKSKGGVFAYKLLTRPVKLAANHTYYLLTQETSGGDKFYNGDTASGGTATAVVPTSGITINSSIFTTNNTTFVVGKAGKYSYGPVNFTYL